MDNKKTILLTDNIRLHKALLPELKKREINIENEIKEISNLNYIKTVINLRKNTKFIQEGFSKFIKQNNSTPVATIIDYRVNIDKDNPRAVPSFPLCRSFVITSALLNTLPDIKYNKYNYILIGTPTDLKIFEIFKSYPHMIFKNLIKSYPALDKILNKYANDGNYTKSLFYFDYLIVDNINNDVTPAVVKFGEIINKILENQEKEQHQEKVKGQTPILSGEFEPAKVLFKISDSRVYVDGKLFNIENNPKFDKYKENIIYIVGHFVNSTKDKVAENIAKLILNDLAKLKKVTPDSPINISVNSHTIVDGSTVPTLSVLIGTKLSQFKNVHILTSNKNLSKFQNSPGFITIRKYIQLKHV